MKYKLFISDYDGTLALGNSIDEQTCAAVEKFIAKGGVFVVCSGRETSSIMRILRQHKFKGLVASFQGARINDVETGESILDGGLSKETALEALNAVKDSGLTPISYGESEVFAQEDNPFVKSYVNAVRLDVVYTDIKERIKKQKENVFKICWLGDNDVVIDVEKRLNAKYNGKGIKFNSGAKCLLEAINPDCGKGQAVRFLSKYYDIPFEEIIAVGDSTNDIDLISGPWHGVAVGSGRDELKAVADEITVPIEQKPVKYLLEKYCLND